MRRFLLGLVVFVLYLIQAQVDSEQTSRAQYHENVEEELNKMDKTEKERWERLLEFVFLQGNSTGYAMGFARGNATGHSEGYAHAEGTSFLISFLCATHGLKGVLEDVYRYPIPSNIEYNHVNIPGDIAQVLINNDEWVRKFNDKRKGKNEQTIQPDIPSISDKLIDSVEAIMAALEKENPTQGPYEYAGMVEKSCKKWYKIVTAEIPTEKTPPFIDNLRNLLKDFQKINEARYKTIEEVRRRFAAHMARSYAMMCALHHKLSKTMKSYAEQHPELSFTEVLFKFAPTWQMSQEQYEFLNILRQILPNQLRSLNHIFFEHNGEWIIFPYDNSEDCGRLMLHKLPTTPMGMTTLASVRLTTTVPSTTLVQPRV